MPEPPFEHLGDNCLLRSSDWSYIASPQYCSWAIAWRCGCSSPDAERYRYRYPVCVRFAEHAKHPVCEIRYASDTRLFLSPHSQAQSVPHPRAPAMHRGIDWSATTTVRACWRAVDFSRAARVLAALLLPDSAPASKRPLDWRNNLAAHPRPAPTQAREWLQRCSLPTPRFRKSIESHRAGIGACPFL